MLRCENKKLLFWLRLIPNALSCARMFSAPFLLGLSIVGNKNGFLILFFVAALTDFLDGFIARALSCENELGGRLDTWGDVAVFMVLPICFYALWPSIFLDDIVFILIAIFSIVVPLFFGVVKFGRLISFHTFLSKLSVFLMVVAVYCVGLFSLDVFLKIACVVQFFAGLEVFAIVFLLHDYRDDIRSVFSLLT